MNFPDQPPVELPIVTLLFNDDSKATVKVPPNEVAPFPTVKSLPASIVTSSFKVVVPVTVKFPSEPLA